MRLNFAARNRGWHSGGAATTRGASAQRITEVSSKPSEPRSHNALSITRASRLSPFPSVDHSGVCLDSSDEIPFAQFNTAVPQDVVGRGAVEIKVGQHEMHQIGLAFETHRVFTKG